MIIESIIGVVLIGTIAYLFRKSNKDAPTTDLNQDGKVSIDDTIDDTNAGANKIEETFNEPAAEQKPKRARNKGKFKPDDKSTPETNEAWVGGKAPEQKPKPKKPKNPKMTVVK
jgi:hypothetical protein